ncbi:nucleotide-binding protein [aff. Roholtiella sp. LEGE 12411]|uniref:nucleotide-binding protein n=1 Tax=aff. Roholtiella sp. LEGE 12411 TaxID=1828822 RepID=UPI001882624A|nr:chromosome partitioning protein ParA [aff. Roholtiella sp. LEGE 12411]
MTNVTAEQTTTEQPITDQTTTEEAISEDTQTNRRLIIVTGDKGGVGKSTFARALLQTYIDTNQEFAAFDADTSNPQIKRFYGDDCEVLPFDIFTRGKADAFLDTLRTLMSPPLKKEQEVPTQPKSLFLLELPSQSIQYFRLFEKEMGFFKILKNDLKSQATMVAVINRTKDSVNQLLQMHDFCNGQVDYVVVKNLFFGESEAFERYDNSASIKKVRDEEGVKLPEIYMPDLIAHAYDYLDENNYSYAQGIAQNEKLSVRGRVNRWMENFKESITPVKDLLGLKDVTLS